MSLLSFNSLPTLLWQCIQGSSAEVPSAVVLMQKQVEPEAEDTEGADLPD